MGRLRGCGHQADGWNGCINTRGTNGQQLHFGGQGAHTDTEYGYCKCGGDMWPPSADVLCVAAGWQLWCRPGTACPGTASAPGCLWWRAQRWGRTSGQSWLALIRCILTGCSGGHVSCVRCGQPTRQQVTGGGGPSFGCEVSCGCGCHPYVTVLHWLWVERRVEGTFLLNMKEGKEVTVSARSRIIGQTVAEAVPGHGSAAVCWSWRLPCSLWGGTVC